MSNAPPSNASTPHASPSNAPSPDGPEAPAHPPSTHETPAADVPPAPVRIRARGRSFLALVLSPERPLTAWLAGLDAQIARSAAFLAGKPIILDLSLLDPDDEGLAELLPALVARDIRIIGIEGCTREWTQLADWDWPDALGGGRASGAIDIPETDVPDAVIADVPAAAAPAHAVPLVVEQPVRSGQSIVHLEGDVIVIGSVSSGAEIVSSGSIHVHGSLRGRAIAGFGGHPESRIFARDMRTELLAIDGYYMTAEDIGDEVLGHPAQALLEGENLIVRKLP